MSNDPIVPPGYVVRYGYVRFGQVDFANHSGLYKPAIDRHIETLVAGAAGGGQPMNAPSGFWRDGAFIITHGRHRFLAAVIVGFEHILIRWLEAIQV